MSDWMERFLEDQARASTRTPTTAGRLFEAPIARPTIEQCDLVDRCISSSRRAGLFIPASLELSWRAPQGGDIPHGCTRAEGGRIQVALSIFQSPWDLRFSTFHELRHVHDFAVGRYVDRPAWEIDADKFARTMVQRDC